MYTTILTLNTILVLEAAVFFLLLSVYLSNEPIIIPMVEAGQSSTEPSGRSNDDDNNKKTSSNIEEEKCYKDKNLQITQQKESGSNTIGDIRTNDEEGMCLEINSDDAKIKTDNNLQKTTSDDNDNNDNEQNCIGENSRCTGINQQSESGNNEIGDINLN
jgi:hypothetical protein